MLLTFCIRIMWSTEILNQLTCSLLKISALKLVTLELHDLFQVICNKKNQQTLLKWGTICERICNLTKLKRKWFHQTNSLKRCCLLLKNMKTRIDASPVTLAPDGIGLLKSFWSKNNTTKHQTCGQWAASFLRYCRLDIHHRTLSKLELSTLYFSEGPSATHYHSLKNQRAVTFTTKINWK